MDLWQYQGIKGRCYQAYNIFKRKVVSQKKIHINVKLETFIEKELHKILIIGITVFTRYWS